jgi:hypothetical protein
MKAIGYKIQRLPIQAAAALTEALNNEQRRLNEDEAPMEGDMEPHWEIDNLFPVGERDNIELFVQWVKWIDRY